MARTPEINVALEKTLTPARLSKYLDKAKGDLDTALKLYEENIKLSEAFYTPLQCVEVCLRNCINGRLAQIYGADWVTNGTPPLNGLSSRMLQDTFEMVGTAPDDVVAELKFSFWVGLLGPSYDETLWKRGVYKAFLAGGGKKRSIVHGRFNVIRRFRNRVMHHETIFDRPLQQLHDEIIEATGWMCRATSDWASRQSRFDEVMTGVNGG